MFSLKINNRNVNFKINVGTLRGLVEMGDKIPVQHQGVYLKGVNTVLYHIAVGEPVTLIEVMKILSHHKITDKDIEKGIESNSNLLVEFKEKLEEAFKKSGFIKTPLLMLELQKRHKELVASQSI